MASRFHLLFIIFLAIMLFPALGGTPVSAQQPDDDPLVLGAWLYQGHCVRCHGPYEQERVGENTAPKELADKIKHGGCSLDWGRQFGGPFSNKEIKAVAFYIAAWEELGTAPNLPNLPAQPTSTPQPTPTAIMGGAVIPTPTITPDPLTDEIRLIITGNRLAWGAWLYNQHCYRCHQAYQDARMGRGLAPEKIETTIKDGVVGNVMPAFSFSNEGPLKTKEIEAVLFYILTWEELDEPPALPAAVMVAPTPDFTKLTPVPLPDIPPVEGDATRGRTLYAIYCVDCHRPNLAGYIGPALTGPRSVTRADLALKAVISQGVPGSLMPGWAVSADGALTDHDINDLTTYLLGVGNVSPVILSDSPVPVSTTSISQGNIGGLLLILVPLLLGTVVFFWPSNY